jgi:hypothetical protein
MPNETEKEIDRKFKTLTKVQREAFKVLLIGLGAGMERSEAYTKWGARKANTISEPCSVACMELVDESFLQDDEHTDLSNFMFDTNGVLDQTLMFILDKVAAL